MKKILYIIGVALAVAGCTKDTDVAAYGDSAISFSIGEIGDAVESRATLKSSWVVDTDLLGLYVPDAGRYNAKYKVASTTNSKATLEAVDSPIYDRRTTGSSWNFYAYYPYSATMSDASAVLAIDVSDQTKDLDLLVASATSAVGNEVKFTFSHALTCVQVEFDFVDGVSLTDADFTNHNMVFGDVTTDATYDLTATSDNLSAGTTLGDVTFSYPSGDNTFTAILVPGAYGGKVMTLNYDEGGLSHEFTFTLSTIEYSAGTIYKYKVTADAVAELEFVSELTWNETEISQEYSTYFDKWIDVASVDYAGGTGTEADPYLITDGYQLAKMAEDVSASDDTYYKLTKDIDLSTNGAQWSAIGDNTNKFQGNFDGDGHTISGLLGTQGLFGWTSGATISHVNVIGDVSGGSQVGGIVGYNQDSTIINCSYSGKVTGSDHEVGGIAGQNDGSSIIVNCYNLAEVSGSYNVGGIVGYNNMGSVKVCYNAGAVTGTSTPIGAVVGSNYGYIYDCYYDSTTSVASNDSGTNTDVTSRTDIKSQDFAAELTALAETYNKTATIKACEWSGSSYSYPELIFDSEALPTDFDGGSGVDGAPYLISNAKQLAAVATSITTYQSSYFKLTADIDLSILGGEWTPIGNSTNQFKGNFDGDGHTISGLYINNNSSYQGLFGHTYGATISNVDVIGYVAGSQNIGGIVGYNQASTIINCSYSGKVKGSSYQVGGIAGFNADTGSIIVNCYNLAEVSGYSYVGGIVGYNVMGSVKVCYNAGAVTGTTETSIGAVVGHLDSSSTSNCYYDSTTSGASDTNATGSDAMQTATFATTLTTAAATYNDGETVKACAWIGSDVNYPTLNFGTEPATN